MPEVSSTWCRTVRTPPPHLDTPLYPDRYLTRTSPPMRFAFRLANVMVALSRLASRRTRWLAIASVGGAGAGNTREAHRRGVGFVTADSRYRS